jgi:hypothetical protein
MFPAALAIPATIPASLTFAVGFGPMLAMCAILLVAAAGVIRSAASERPSGVPRLRATVLPHAAAADAGAEHPLAA